FMDADAENYEIPHSVNFNGKNYPVTVIGAHAFANHRKLTSIVIPDSITEVLGDSETQTGAFSGCLALTTIDFGHGMMRIGKYAFKNCFALSAVTFPASVQFIEDGAFQGCLALESIQLNSNGILGVDCFADCTNVTTLKLADNVRLTDSACQVLSDLAKLSTFLLTENHPVYRVQTAGEGQCLLTTTIHDNDTVVLGGYGATMPNNVTQIDDWAWGKRASDNLYVPSTVTKVGANSFVCKSICTDADTKPNDWLTTIPVYTQAQLITFEAAGNTKDAYIYHDTNDVLVKPEYDELFGDVVTETPFIDWGVVSGATCSANYQSNQMATNLSSFNTALATANAYINDEETRSKFKLDFWEKFKSIYYTAVAINEPSSAYQYEIDELATDLGRLNAQIAAANDPEILESENWRVGLQNLVMAVEKIDLSDLPADVDVDLLEQLGVKIQTAKSIILNTDIDNETGNYVWRELRALYENLEVDIGAESALMQEITTCENMSRADYTKVSWQTLQKQLALAKQITKHNLSISAVRENLLQARKSLCEITLPERLVRLGTWISICRDLPSRDFQSKEYDRLLIETHLVIGNAENLINNTEVDAAISNLRNRYDNLVAVDSSSDYQRGIKLLNRKSIPYFIIVVMLFTVAVATGAKATKLKKILRQSQE
ncbi:MAG: leucine-rich repeat domain-containing protein, partial [Clostridia bacterium]|nr:leucine-rich repeat domain-containing protein [Clostridia bacterium]